LEFNVSRPNTGIIAEGSTLLIAKSATGHNLDQPLAFLEASPTKILYAFFVAPSKLHVQPVCKHDFAILTILGDLFIVIRLNGLDSLGLIPGRGRFVSYTTSRLSPLLGTLVLSSGAEWPECKANHFVVLRLRICGVMPPYVCRAWCLVKHWE
jgi:hypothetical protein